MKRVMMQAYVKNSDKALKLYKEAFGAEVESEYRNDDGVLVHAELNIYGNIVALSESGMERIPGTTMQFCFHYGKDNEDAVKKAYEVLKDSSEILHPLGETFFSPLMADFIDEFGVRWCIFV